MNATTSARPVEKGSTVKYQDGWYRVSVKFNTTVNLCGIFSGRIAHKKVPLTEVREDYDNWSEHWHKSETYQSM